MILTLLENYIELIFCEIHDFLVHLISIYIKITLKRKYKKMLFLM